MRMTRSEFLGWPHKAITLLGMSGVGKTTLAYKLPTSKWFHYSGDYRIGTKYLAEPILDNIKRQAMQVDFLRELLRSDSIYIASNVTFHNLQPVSSFLGKIGRTDLGGLPVTEFKRRQRLHREAEIGAMRDVADFIGKAQEIYGYDHFINDAGGSLVELEDVETEKTLAEHTLILYLKPDDQLERELVRRAVTDPKPLYYNEPFLDRKPQHLADEGFTGRADQERLVERAEFIQPRENFQIMIDGFTEADARVQNEPFPGDAGLFGKPDPRFEELRDLADDIGIDGLDLHILGGSLHMHKHHRNALPGRKRRHFRIEAECADVVDDARPGREGPPSDFGFGGINRDRDRQSFYELFDGRDDTSDFFFDRNRSRARSGGYSADVDEVGAFFRQSLGLPYCVVRFQKPASVREGIRCDVQDTH